MDNETAEIYESSSAVERRKIDLLISLKLRDVIRKGRALEEIMESMGRKAQERGLTPEMLDAILAES